MKNYIICFIILFFFSCSTMEKIYLQNELDKAMVTGRVINEEGLPLEGANVKLNKVIETQTDINGRFLFNVVAFGKHKLYIDKQDYTSETMEFTYTLKHKRKRHPFFIKAKLFSFNYLMIEGFESLKEKDYQRVRKILDQMASIDEIDESYLYLKAVYHIQVKKYQDAARILEKLKQRNRKNLYYQLTLIEVYHNLKWYQKEADLSYYLGRNNQEHYSYLKKAAAIYRDQLKSPEEYERIIKEYEQMKTKKKNSP